MAEAATEARPLPEPDHVQLFNRELSWVRFNERVLNEARSKEYPVLERLKFLSIFSSNLDEFFMIRVASLKDQISARIHDRSPDGLTPQQQVRLVASALEPLLLDHSQLLIEEVIPLLRQNRINLRRYSELTQPQQRQLNAHFEERIFPVLTPMAVDTTHPFPLIHSLFINLLVELRDPEPYGETKSAVVPIPHNIPRFVPVSRMESPRAEGYDFVLVEDLIRANLGSLFQHMQVTRVSEFRITRNADLDIAEAEAEDLLKLIERELRKRRLGSVVRMEVSDSMTVSSVRFLRQIFNLQSHDIYRVTGPLSASDFMQLLGEVECPELRFPPFTPALHPQIVQSASIFAAIGQGDILLHHPYDSFNPVVALIQQAAKDDNVLAIKQTLYRTSGKSLIVQALREAADNGKQVTALIELKARFDEEKNITWARALEQAGVNVIYGVAGLKTHCKMTLILRQEEDQIRHYVHLSTGNYNEKTAEVYTDISLLSANKDLGRDLSEAFNVLTGYSRQSEWRKLLVAPVNLRQKLTGFIEQAAQHHTPDQPSRIRMVMNSLVDPEMIERLYRASCAGVQVDLVVRGICCLVPGVPGMSERIRVRSIVGRFLEHARIYHFEFGGQVHIYCGSADLMTRNLNHRIEVLYPIEEQQLKANVSRIVDTMLTDNAKAYLLSPDGLYNRVQPNEGQPHISAQETFLRRAETRQRATDTIYPNQP